MSAALVLDLLLAALLLAQLAAGYREGLLVGLAGLAGLLGGALAGVVALPRLVAGWAPGVRPALVVVVGTLVLAVLGRLLLGTLAARLRGRVRSRPARVADSLLGALAGAVATLLVLWVVAGAARTAPLPAVVRAVTGSRVVGTVDAALPADPGALLGRFWSAARASGFPRVFAGLDPEPIAPVDPPAAAVPDTPGLRAAQGGVVKVTGVAAACGRGLEGSGFVAARRGGSARVVTNAHVVAGVGEPLVQPQGAGRRYPARVVAFDPARDLAVLDVPGLDAAAVPRSPLLQRGDAAVVAGFPLDGPYTLATARVREVVRAEGRDVYDAAPVVREVYSVHSQVQPGNSGGPLLTEDGRVAGVVFAKSLDDPHTGYALTPVELDAVLAAAGSATAPADTGPCAAA
ncbi:MarP family serine protease [Kineococcus indalonis]|uniref:MarP family serine protease n=1 Tax=Kineococcus indalonis TaxID=2696566 RepID=UPI001412451F|nr:MarP family serine protease [Kineococcus indalonis]NAZ87988.1 MarP family serine protease [Kineococcus indalonis]